ncbi:MAG: ABC transporter permease [Clostridiales bacterium]|nr:ABC transporter permease [Clostridiales bacterium]
MKNGNSGFTPVYKYTVKNSFKSGKYIGITVVIAILIMAGIAATIIITGNPQKDDNEPFDITKVYVADKTELGIPDYAAYAAALESENLKDVIFVPCKDEKAELEKNKDSEEFVLAVSEKNDDGYLISVVTTENTKYENYNLEILGNELASLFQYHIYSESGLSDEALMQSLIPVKSSVIDFGDDDDGIKEIVEIVCFFVVLMLIYFVTLTYGQQVCTEVSIEKSSKLVEQLLISVKPYGLVAGKVLGVITTSIIQFVIWFASVFAGIFGGDYAAGVIYEGYESRVKSVLNLLKSLFGGMAFEPQSIALAIILIFAGLTFYLTLAGFAGSFVTKPENATNVQTIFVFPIVISFFVVLFAMVDSEGKVPYLLHFIPFTSAMITPASVFIGNIPLWMGLLSLALTAVGVCVLMFLAAKIYKGLLFFAGEKVSLKTIIKAVKSK